uniref:Nuclear transport factor 2 n=1 Tax=Aegilops tauschii TaxID=37682 RepID=M8AVF3_AEGTA
MDPDSVSKAFVQHYYQTFDSNRAALVGLYQDGSMLTFEGEKFGGPAAIAGKLGSLPFQQCQHKIDTVDCQPSGPQGGVLVFVSGTITTGPGEHPLKFSQIICIALLHHGALRWSLINVICYWSLEECSSLIHYVRVHLPIRMVFLPGSSWRELLRAERHVPPELWLRKGDRSGSKELVQGFMLKQ